VTSDERFVELLEQARALGGDLGLVVTTRGGPWVDGIRLVIDSVDDADSLPEQLDNIGFALSAIAVDRRVAE
jgi:hypothetical protein